MNNSLNKLIRPACAAVALLMISFNALAADCPKDIKAVTAKDAEVSVQVLEHLVKPLTKCELEAEAGAWLGLLQDKVREISEAEIAALYKKEEIKKTKSTYSVEHTKVQRFLHIAHDLLLQFLHLYPPLPWV